MGTVSNLSAKVKMIEVKVGILMGQQGLTSDMIKYIKEKVGMK